MNRGTYIRSGFLQYVTAFILIALTTLVCRIFTGEQAYFVAFILLSEVSVMAVFMGIGPILLASTLSSLVWNFFFLPPHFALHIERPEDKLMFVSFFSIALINGVLTNRIRRQEKLASLKEEQALLLAESDKLYKTLFTLISHEFRIPIAAIIGATDTLQSGQTSEKDKTALFDEILKASARLNHLIENLLNMSRLESGKISVRKDWVDINDLLNKVISTLSQQLDQHKLVTSVPGDLPLVQLDFGLMEQVLYNLILNSCQYSPSGTTITLTTAYIDGNLVLTISDEGPGFPPPMLDKVFTKFFRVDNQRSGGLGLGLSIVKGLVDAHKGHIIVKNNENAGAMFIISIPTGIPDLVTINKDNE